MEISGNTGVLSLFDLAQMLSVNEASGHLKVESGDERGYLYFDKGMIINALDPEHQEGEDAARYVFSLRDAAFAFSADLPSVAKRIDCTTQNLMMEVARQLDELDADPDRDGPSHGERFRDAQQATEQLKDIFDRLSTESEVLTHRSPQGFRIAELLETIEDAPGAILYLRPSTPPQVLAGGRIIPLSDAALDIASYESLRDHLLRQGSARPLALPGVCEERVLSLGAQGRYRLERLVWEGGEMLTVARLEDAGSGTARLSWPAQTIDLLLAEPGAVVLLAAPDAHALARAFASVCAHLVTGGPAPFVGFAERWSPEAASGPAASLFLSTFHDQEVRSAEPVIERLAPAIVAVENCDRVDALRPALAAMRRGARVLLGVCARSLSHAPQRLIEATPPGERAGLLHHLGTSLTGVLSIVAGPAAIGQAWMVEEPSRTALLNGDISPLANELASFEAG